MANPLDRQQFLNTDYGVIDYGGSVGDFMFDEFLRSGFQAGEANVFEDWFNSAAAGQRDMLQQYLLTNKQNQWNSAQQQMQRAKEAGINPLTAAAGIAGSGTSSAVSSPASERSVNPLGDIASLGDTASKFGLLGSQNELNKAMVADFNAKRDPAVQNIIADTFKKYKEAGYTDLQAQGLAIANAYLPTEKFLGIVAMNSNIDVLHGQYLNLMKDIDVKKARIDEINKHISEMGASISLMEKQALTEEARKLQIEADTAETNWFNQKRQELGVDPKSPIENQLFMMGVTGNPNYTKGMQIVYDTQYFRSAGNIDPQMEFNWDSPPKTAFEFLSKSVAQIKSKWFGKSDGEKLIDDKPVSKMSTSDLRNSYLEYQQQLNYQYQLLNFMKVDCIDESTGKIKDYDTYTEVQKKLSELDKMPQSFNAWKKSVYNDLK